MRGYPLWVYEFEKNWFLFGVASYEKEDAKESCHLLSLGTCSAACCSQIRWLCSLCCSALSPKTTPRQGWPFKTVPRGRTKTWDETTPRLCSAEICHTKCRSKNWGLSRSRKLSGSQQLQNHECRNISISWSQANRLRNDSWSSFLVSHVRPWLKDWI